MSCPTGLSGSATTCTRWAAPLRAEMRNGGTGTLEEMQTICALAALVNFCINEQERLSN